MRRNGRWIGAPLMPMLMLALGAGTARAGGPNNALRFDPAMKSIVDVGGAKELALETWTIEAWFRISGSAQRASTGFWGTRLAPLVAKGIDTAVDGINHTDINFTVGLGADEQLEGDLECLYVPELHNGAASGANHPVRAATLVPRLEWHHAAYTYDGATWRVYLDGQLDGWTQAELLPQIESRHPVAIGAGRSSFGAAEGFFSGIIDEVRIWDHARTADEIRAGVNVEIEAAEGLLGRWGMNEEDGTTVFDSSGNGFHGEATGTERVPGAPFDIDLAPEVPVLVAPPDGGSVARSDVTLEVSVTDPEKSFLDVTLFGRPLAPPREDAFTIVVLPDTQAYLHHDGLEWMFAAMTQYAVDERIPRRVELVVHVGDLVHVDETPQWDEANAAMTILEDAPLLPYIMGVGNHDQTPRGDPCGTELFNTYFPFTRYEALPWYGGHFGKDNDNSYVLFSVGDVDYIAVSVEYNARPESIAWADGILDTYADRRAILVTHAMVAPFGRPLFTPTAIPIWEGLKHHSNLFLVLAGHVWGEGLRTEVVDGNVVDIIVTNYQERLEGGNGYLRLLELAPGDDAIRVRTWSPTLGTFELDYDSEYWLNEEEPGGPWTELARVGTQSGGTVAWTWPSLVDDRTYEWRVEVSDGERVELGGVWSFEVAFGAGDATGDGLVTFADVLAVLGAWGTDDPNADVDDDGVVDLDDLLLVLSNWTMG